MYYIDNSLNPENKLLGPKYNKILFDYQNLAGYNIVFILKVLSDYNNSQYKTKYKYRIYYIFKDDKI